MDIESLDVSKQKQVFREINEMKKRKKKKGKMVLMRS